jgi:energy-coupling factor transporter ATP-binding protein EcfA2
MDSSQYPELDFEEFSVSPLAFPPSPKKTKHGNEGADADTSPASPVSGNVSEGAESLQRYSFDASPSTASLAAFTLNPTDSDDVEKHASLRIPTHTQSRRGNALREGRDSGVGRQEQSLELTTPFSPRVSENSTEKRRHGNRGMSLTIPDRPANLEDSEARDYITPIIRTPTGMSRGSRTPASGSPTRSPLQLAVPDGPRERRSSVSSARLSIREGSRPRSGSRGDVGAQCSMCNQTSAQVWSCSGCFINYCEPCWPKQPLHKMALSAAEGLAHERTAYDVAKKIKAVLSPSTSDLEREKQHREDIDTTWFGVVREDGGPHLFRDYGRYANLIGGVKQLRLKDPGAIPSLEDETETLYPGLVSFVGQTGAGKSTLIRLLIDLSTKPDEREDFPTPVVGEVGRDDVATSEDVHLYLDPATFEYQAPLLFADCEGLEGGEREPLGARIKKKIEEKARQEVANGTGRRKTHLKHTSERRLGWSDRPERARREFAVAELYPRVLYTFSDVIVFVLKNPR